MLPKKLTTVTCSLLTMPRSLTSQHSVIRRPNDADLDPLQLAYMAEECIAVDDQDNIIKSVSKKHAHKMPGLVLHRAFSVFAFTPSEKLILQKRSDTKITFPSLWTNTCCSHPLYTESEMNGEAGVKRAAIRKLEHELGMTGIAEEQCSVLGRYLYQAPMSNDEWGEHELDYGVVIKNIGLDRIERNPEEVCDVMEIDERTLDNWILKEPELFSPWFTLFVQQRHLSKWWSSLKELEDIQRKDIVKMN